MPAAQGELAAQQVAAAYSGAAEDDSAVQAVLLEALEELRWVEMYTDRGRTRHRLRHVKYDGQEEAEGAHHVGRQPMP